MQREQGRSLYPQPQAEQQLKMRPRCHVKERTPLLQPHLRCQQPQRLPSPPLASPLQLLLPHQPSVSRHPPVLLAASAAERLCL